MVPLQLGLILGSPTAQAADLQVTTSGPASVELLDRGLGGLSTLLLSGARTADGRVLPLPGVVDAQGHTLRDMARACAPTGGSGRDATPLLTSHDGLGGCRVYLDADPSTPEVDPVAAGTVLSFEVCHQDTPEGPCTQVWASDPSRSSDGVDRFRTTPLYAALPDYSGRIVQLGWEPAPGAAAGQPGPAVVLRLGMDDDGDGLWNDWETEGIDADGDGRVDLVPPSADRFRKDIYVEVDFMDCPDSLLPGTTGCHRPDDRAMQEVITAFDSSPVPNPATPDGSPGRPGITLHLDIDEAIPHLDEVIWDDDGVVVDCAAPANPSHFVCIKQVWVGSAAQRSAPATLSAKRFFYHYSLWAHDYSNSGGASGMSETPGNDLLITLGTAAYALNAAGNHPAGNERQQAGTFMHELGHNLGLRHGGGDDIGYKPNYLSVMNYLFQFDGIRNSNYPTNRLDYSRQRLITLDERALVEVNGVLGYGADALTPAVAGDQTRWCTTHPGPMGSLFGNQAGPVQGLQQACGDTLPVTADAEARWLNWDFSFVSQAGGIVQTAKCSAITADINGGNGPGQWGLCNGNTEQGTEVLVGFDDWANLVFTSQCTANHQDGKAAQPLGFTHEGWEVMEATTHCPENIQCDPQPLSYWADLCETDPRALEAQLGCVSRLSTFASRAPTDAAAVCGILRPEDPDDPCAAARAALLGTALNLCTERLDDCCSFEHPLGATEGYTSDTFKDIDHILRDEQAEPERCEQAHASLAVLAEPARLVKTRKGLVRGRSALRRWLSRAPLGLLAALGLAPLVAFGLYRAFRSR